VAGTPQIVSALAVNVNEATDGVRFDFRVTNAGGTRIEVNFPSGQTHEVIVLDTLGREVWRWSDGRMFTQVLQNKVLRSDDTLAYGERLTTTLVLTNAAGGVNAGFSQGAHGIGAGHADRLIIALGNVDALPWHDLQQGQRHRLMTEAGELR